MTEISSWRVQDFKSLLDVELPFPPLTVLAGANSAGKSSILQSLLMLAQTNRTSESVVLNGPLVRLGLPQDVVRSGQDSIKIDFTITSSGPDSNEIETFPLSVAITLAPIQSGNHLSVASLRITDPENKVLLEAVGRRVKSADSQNLREKFPESISILRMTVQDGIPAPSRTYLVFKGIYPLHLVSHRSPKSLQTSYDRMLNEVCTESNNRLTRSLVFRLTRLFGRESTLDSIRNILGLSIAEDLTDDEKVVDTIRILGKEQRKELVSILAMTRSDGEFGFLHIESLYYGTDYGYRMRQMLDPVASDTHADFVVAAKVLPIASEELDSLARRIQYLGPLREEPRVLNNSWDQRSPSLPVGVRGELTAEILASRRNELVRFCNWSAEPYAEYLPMAVGLWANYLGIGENVSVLDEGKLGRGVNLEVNGVLRDLTTIGVGASQLLPVLVACLGVAPGSIMLVEQPELHLHPAVQSRLADFFLFARPDISLVVETHSEYLVTRVRRRVAEERLENTSVSFLFAEQTGGRTAVRSLTMDKYGDLSEWPKGFFDAQDEESRGIVRAVSARLKARA